MHTNPKFFRLEKGRFRPSWWGESKKRAGVNVRVNEWQVYSNVRDAAAQTQIFQMHSVNVIA